MSIGQNKRFDSIIFDLDGTLWDSSEQAVTVYCETCGEVSKESLQSLQGLPCSVIMKTLYPDMEEKERDAKEQFFYRRFHEHLYEKPAKLFPGVIETLTALSRTYRLFVVSNSQAGYIETFIDINGLEDIVEGFLSFGDTRRGKAENISQVIREYNLQNAVYVGDIQKDSDAAHQAGIPMVAATYGFGEIHDAEYEIQNIAELEHVIQ